MTTNYLFSRKSSNVWCLLVLALLLIHSHRTWAQQKPPRPISVHVSPMQGLQFGAFFQASTGGTITVDPNGTRSSTGDVVLANLGFMYSPAIFEVETQAGTLISNTVGNWEGKELSSKLELEVGKDLQFIRINGTLVGGLVGLIIYTISKLI